MTAKIQVPKATPGVVAAEQSASFKALFDELGAQDRDRQLVVAVAAGRFDALADEALRDLREGRTTLR